MTKNINSLWSKNLHHLKFSSHVCVFVFVLIRMILIVYCRILEFEAPNISIGRGKNMNAEIELWDCSGDRKWVLFTEILCSIMLKNLASSCISHYHNFEKKNSSGRPYFKYGYRLTNFHWQKWIRLIVLKHLLSIKPQMRFSYRRS